MGQPVHTYTTVYTTPFEFEKIISLKITQELNEHAKLYLNGIVPEEKIDQYVENSDDSETIKVSFQIDDNPTEIFQGIVTNITIQAVRNIRSITIEALSSTFLMDVQKQSRSFQDKNETYTEIISSLTKQYPNPDLIDEATNGKATGGLLVQYQETDWEFIKRLASHFNAPLVPACRLEGVKYYIGVPELPGSNTLEEYNYTISKNIEDYKVKSANDIGDIEEQDLLNYEITTTQILDLCSPVQFQDKTLYVFKAVIEMENGILTNTYSLRDKKGFSCRRIINRSLIGLSLFGKILDVAKDQVKVHLEIDPEQPAGKALWFPYSTVYSSPDGSGWYCMPETGDQIRLYFPDEDEKNAFAASSVNLASTAPQKRSDPSVKSISTKYGKQIIFQPGAIEIIGGGQLLMRLTDDGGIEINSDKKISLSAAGDIEIGGSQVFIQGDQGIDLKQSGADLNILQDVTLSGGKVNIK